MTKKNFALSFMVGVVIVTLITVAIEGLFREDEVIMPGISAESSSDSVSKISLDFADLKSDYHLNSSKSWVGEIRPGASYFSDMVEVIGSMEALLNRLDNQPHGDQTTLLRAEIHEVVIEEMNRLLEFARREGNLIALGNFLDFAREFDLSGETFGVPSLELRNEAVQMAISEVSRYRSGVLSGNSDQIGHVRNISEEWGIPLKDLGLTEKEIEALGGE